MGRIAFYWLLGSQNRKKDYLGTLLYKVDILCIQEHWLSELQLSFLGDIDDGFGYTGVSGFDNSTALQGRPYGGCGILWRLDIASTVSTLAIDSKRLCVVRIESNEWKVGLLPVFVYVYLPSEDGYANINAFSAEVSHLRNYYYY